MPSEVADITSSNVFEYQNEVIVELHGTTTDGELTVISYSFDTDSDDQTQVTARERIENVHREAVEHALDAADYTLA